MSTRAARFLSGMAVTGCLASGCGEKPPNIILISIDSLRHDRLGYAGYDRPVSPSLDSLAVLSRVFPRAYSQAGWTLPSMATVLTGRYPYEHGATQLHRGIDRRLPTLAGRLSSEAGYDTRAYVSHLILTPAFGFDRGFGVFDARVLEEGNPHLISTAGSLTDHALAGLAEAREPFFLWVHHFDPHFEYLPHAPWAGFGDAAADRYDQEIALTDREIGRFLRGLRDKGAAKNTIVIVIADHGEEFGDHGGGFHYTCYDEVARIPFLAFRPGAAAVRDDAIVQQIDIYPTLLRAAGLDPGEGLPGRDLFTAPGGERPVFVERERPAGFRQRAVVSGGFKLIAVSPADDSTLPQVSRTTAHGAPNVVEGLFLFDLTRDPGEQVNLFGGGSEQERALSELLVAFGRLKSGALNRVDLSDETRERLRALGYAN